MGGKGGDGGGGGGGGRAQYDSELGMWFENGYAIEEGTGNITGKTRADILAERAPKPEVKAAPAPEPVAAPAPAPMAVAAPEPVQAIGPPVATGTPVPSPTVAGNPIGDVPTDTPGLGDALGEGVTTPPRYWVGGLGQNNLAQPRPTRGYGSLRTTQ